MLSLDKDILAKTSESAKRMNTYGVDQPHDIVVPSAQTTSKKIGPSVTVYPTGGKTKIVQLLRMFFLARKLTKQQGSYSLITPQDPFFLGAVAVIVGSARNVPVEVQLHGDFFDSKYFRSRHRFKYHLGKWVLARATTVRVVGERVRKSVARLVKEGTSITVRPVVSAHDKKTTMPAEQQKELQEHKPYCLFLGRFEDIKNPLFLLDVFAMLKNMNSEMKLVLAGGGSLEKKMRKKIKAKMLQDVVVVYPWTAYPHEYLAHAEALLFPSYAEGYGRAPMEANELGTAVITANVGVAGYELPASDSVTVIDTLDVSQWADAIAGLLNKRRTT